MWNFTDTNLLFIPLSLSLSLSWQYLTEEAVMKDFSLMFDNARHYNEEGSMVYEDANLLEALLKDKCNEINLSSGPG